jgi:uncharacterized protein YutE (UPF0331/DUF86 family)
VSDWKHDVVLRAEAVRERLLRLEEVISRLEEMRRAGRAAVGASFRDEWAVERGLQLGAEIVFDIGNHILSAHFGVSAADYEDIVLQLAVNGVIDSALRERLRGLGGFRNILVHGYLRVDRERVLDALARAPGDFADFAAAIRHWLEHTIK